MSANSDKGRSILSVAGVSPHSLEFHVRAWSMSSASRQKDNKWRIEASP